MLRRSNDQRVCHHHTDIAAVARVCRDSGGVDDHGVFEDGCAQSSTTVETTLLARLASNGGLRYVEAFQQRRAWIAPDIGYIDFGEAGEYREVFVGGGVSLHPTSRLTFVQEAFIDKPTGRGANGAVYLFPWTLVNYRVNARISAQVVYFPYFPLNSNGRFQQILERAKMEYGLAHFRIGGGYSGSQSGDAGWRHKPFVTRTLLAGTFGNIEIWILRLPGNSATVQMRYAKLFR